MGSTATQVQRGREARSEGGAVRVSDAMPPAWSGRAQIDLADLRDAPTPLFADCQTLC
jgi:hypothetical protein